MNRHRLAPSRRIRHHIDEFDHLLEGGRGEVRYRDLNLVDRPGRHHTGIRRILGEGDNRLHPGLSKILHVLG